MARAAACACNCEGVGIEGTEEIADDPLLVEAVELVLEMEDVSTLLVRFLEAALASNGTFPFFAASEAFVSKCLKISSRKFIGITLDKTLERVL